MLLYVIVRQSMLDTHVVFIVSFSVVSWSQLYVFWPHQCLCN